MIYRFIDNTLFYRNDLISSNRIKSFIQSRYFIWGILLLIVSILLILLVDYNREDTLTFSAYNLSKVIYLFSLIIN